MSDLFSRFDGHGIGEEDITDDDVTASFPPVSATRAAGHVTGIAEVDKSMSTRTLMMLTVAVALLAFVGLGIFLVKVFA